MTEAPLRAAATNRALRALAQTLEQDQPVLVGATLLMGVALRCWLLELLNVTPGTKDMQQVVLDPLVLLAEAGVGDRGASFQRLADLLVQPGSWLQLWAVEWHSLWGDATPQSPSPTGDISLSREPGLKDYSNWAHELRQLVERGREQLVQD